MKEINCSSQDSYDAHGRWVNKEDWDAQEKLTRERTADFNNQPSPTVVRLWNKIRNKCK